MDSERNPGSTTNASDAVDDIQLPVKPTTDDLVDAGIKETFPASDPVSVPHPSGSATTQPPQSPKRSADWMFEKK